ncbi:MAG TPA: GNAT family N-acetyltransferase [Lysobacter sp.]
MLIFETPHLRLRPLKSGDEALYRQLYTDPEVMRHIGAPMTVEAARRSFRIACRVATRDGASAERWVVLELGSPAAIGLLGLIPGESGADEAEIGLMLLAERQRRSVAVAVIGAVADRLFHPLGEDAFDFQALQTRHAPANVAAMRLMSRLGFLRQPSCGLDQTEVRWRMPRDRWNAGRERKGMEKRNGCS